MSSCSTPGREQAIVIGGSIAGLLAARALSGHFRRVALVERDTLERGPAHRRGIPQGRHTHALLAGGLRAIAELFPDVGDRLQAAGALRADVSGDSWWFLEGGRLAEAPSGIEGIAVSRPLLEMVVRECVRELPNVEIQPGAQVDRLLVNSERRVTGVRVGNRELAADITVDASGRGSRAPKWLAEMGYSAPEDERVEVGLGYTTRRFRRESSHFGGKTAAVIPPTPAGKRGGVALAQEGDVWIVTLFAHFGHYAPADLDGFIEYSQSLPTTWIYEMIRTAEPVGEPSETRFPASRRRRYERLRRFPDGFLVVGDAICSFNPIYGQGMSSSALQAVELDRALEGGDRRLWQRFFQRAAAVVNTPWEIAVGADLRMPEVNAPRPLSTRFGNWYMAKLHRAAHGDASLAHAFFRVSNLLAPTVSVLAPGVAWRVLRGNLRGSGSEVPGAQPR